MERAEWFVLMEVKCKLLAMEGGFIRAREHLKKWLERKAVLSFSKQCLRLFGSAASACLVIAESLPPLG